MGQILVIPAEGVKVPFPGNPKTYLPSEGAIVREGVYWTRRLIEKSITIGKKTKPKQEETKKHRGGN